MKLDPVKQSICGAGYGVWDNLHPKSNLICEMVTASMIGPVTCTAPQTTARPGGINRILTDPLKDASPAAWLEAYRSIGTSHPTCSSEAVSWTDTALNPIETTSRR